MMAPGWITDVFAAVMLAAAAASAARLVAARPWQGAARDADIDAAHLLMGVSMAGRLATGLRTLPAGAWETTFGVLTAWFAWCVYREARGQGARVLSDGRCLPHLVHSAAMLYMFAAPAVGAAAGGGPGMSGMGGVSGPTMQTLRLPAVALAFAVWLCAYVVLDLDRLSGPAWHARGSYFARVPPAPAGAALAGASATEATASVAAPAGGVAQRPVAGTSPEPGSAVTGSGPGTSPAFLLSPRLAAVCRIAMGVTMAFMLVIMI